MEIRTNSDEYESLSWEQLIELEIVYGRFKLALGGLWFLEAKRLKELLRIDEVTSLERVCRIFLLSPAWGNLGATAEVNGESGYLTIPECRPQIGRRRKGLAGFPCKPVGIAFSEGLLSALHPEIRFLCCYYPADDHPADSWCRWEVWFAKSEPPPTECRERR